MSAVRMCDRCGSVFAEGAEGASVGTVTANERNPRTGRLESVTKSMDIGPCCGATQSPAPRFAVGSVATKSNPRPTRVDTAHWDGEENEVEDVVTPRATGFGAGVANYPFAPDVE